MSRAHRRSGFRPATRAPPDARAGRARASRGVLELAELAVADELHSGPIDQVTQGGIFTEVGVVLDPPRPVAVGGAQLVRVDARMQIDLGHPRPEVEEHALDPTSRANGAEHEMVGEHDPFLFRESPGREPRAALAAAA